MSIRTTRPLFARSALALFFAPLCTSSLAQADVTWPAEQALPTFSAPAQTQDLILLRASSTTWQAEGPALGHATGHLDGDGWLCQTGVDAPGKHMIYGPYETGLPAGDNTARFRLKIDNNTADDAHQVTVDVRDSTTGTVLASQDISRKDFSVAGDWVTFSLPFSLPAAGHSVELRVYWVGSAYIKVDSVSTDRGSEAELALFASLKGVVNKTKPRVFSYEGDAFAEGKFTWLESLGLTWTEIGDNWTLLQKYRNEIDGLVVYDAAVPDTINLATTLAGPKNALVVAPSLVKRLTEAPYDFPIVEDLRGKFSNKLEVYEELYNQHWPNLTHRVLFGLSPVFHQAAVREYAAALGAGAIWLDPKVPTESALLDQFLSSMDPTGVYMGWWPEEGPGVQRASEHGIPTVASDYATNLTLHSGMPRTVRVKPIPPKPRLENKIYVAFILSDGDNLQYVEHLMRKLWNDPARGQVPIGWTVSPAMLDAMPGALDFYHASGTDADNLISGPSGIGYGYPNFWSGDAQLSAFVKTSDDYSLRAGLRVVTVWNTIVGGIDADVGSSFATHAPSLLGVTAQNTGGGLTIYDGKLPGFALSCNYCTNEQAIKDHVASAAAGWDGASPRFILIQAQPWQGVTPTSFRNVQDSFDDSYSVVRPDNWFQLLRQANGLPVEPHATIVDGVYRLASKASGKCVAVVSSAEQGAPVQQVTCADDDAQRFRFTATESGYYEISPLIDDTLRIDIEGGSAATGDGAKAVLASATETTSQEWQPVWEADSTYHFIARHSDRCFDLPSGTSEEGVQFQQWVCNGSTAQGFELLDSVWPPEPPEPEPDPSTEEPDMPNQVPSDSDPEENDGSAQADEADAGCACATVPNVSGASGQLLGVGLLPAFARVRRALRTRHTRR